MNWINDKRIYGVSLLELCLVLVAVSMPYNNNWNSYAIVLFAVVSFFSNPLREKFPLLKEHRRVWLLPACYVAWVVLSMLWDNGNGKSFSKLEKYASLLVFPILLSSMNQLNKAVIKKILVWFVVSNIIASFYCIYQAYLEYVERDYINVFFYHHLSMHIGINAIYFSLYCVFCILILLFYFLFSRHAKLWVQVIALTGVAYLVVFVILLSSKMFIFLLYMAAVSITIYSYYYFNKVRLGSLITLATLIAIPILLLQFPYVQSRIQETMLKEYRGVSDDQNGLAVRGVLWKSSINVLSQKPILGWGRNGVSTALKQQYALAGFKEGVIQDYNSHNQYLYTWACYGLVGFALLLLMLGSITKYMFAKRNFLGIYLSLLFVIAIITECMLEVQHGVVFFFFFTSLFIVHAPLGRKQDQGK